MLEIKRIKLLSILIFLIPLLTINFCLFYWGTIGKYDIFGTGVDYSTETTTYSTVECPIENKSCIKNSPTLYKLYTAIPILNSIHVKSHLINAGNISEPSFPYIDGKISISRSVRSYPTAYIFKPLMLISSIIIIFYWLNYFFLFKKIDIKKYNIPSLFLIFGIMSGIALAIHTIFLGVDYEYEWYQTFRRIIIILFILNEILAQVFLVRKLIAFKQQMKPYINFPILNLKLIFVILVSIITVISFYLLIFFEMDTSFKHILEWNYFSGLLIFYFLSFVLWKPLEENQVHAPFGT